MMEPLDEFPALKAALEEQRALAQHIADHFGWMLEDAITALIEDDRLAMEAFSVGNAMPREFLH